MSAPVFVERNGHRTWLKWHRARRRRSDPVFTGARILEGMAAGASVEVDLVVTGDRGLAVLHDHADVSHETTGHGPAAALSDARIRALHLRDNEGRPIGDRVMLLADLCALLMQAPPHPDALLQLDFKEGQGPLAAATVDAFARAVRPVATSMIVSSGEGDPVRRFADATPGLRVGYDPCHGDAVEKLRRDGDFAAFAAEALAPFPDAELIYIHHAIVLGGADAGFDLVGAMHAAGRRVDAYTIGSADAATRPVLERLLGLGVDQITTDDPEGVAAMLEEGR